MKILNTKPPIWKEANELFKIDKLNIEPIFAYGNTLYNPFNILLTEDLIAHEEKHSEQQQHDDTCAKLWWQRYLIDPEFRLQQEVEAYHAQYKSICKKYRDPNRRARNLHEFARQLSSPLYGGIITHTAAMTAIRNGGIINTEKSGSL